MILDMGVDVRYNSPVTSMKALLDEGYDAVFVGTRRARGQGSRHPRPLGGRANIHIGIDWLESVAFGHIDKIGERVLIIGVGNTAMDCCRTSRRLGGKDIKVMARRPRRYFKASPWELEDAEEEQVEIVINHAPKSLRGRERQAQGDGCSTQLEWDDDGRASQTSKVASTPSFLPADDVILAIGQENAFPWIERDIGIEFDKWDMPVVDKTTFQSTRAGRLLRRRRGLGPGEHHLGRRARPPGGDLDPQPLPAASPLTERPPQGMNLVSQKMGLHEWSYSNDYNPAKRQKMKHVDLARALQAARTSRSSWASTPSRPRARCERCLNCDIQTVFTDQLCIECDACIDVCPVQCLTIAPDGEEAELRKRLTVPALNLKQDALRLGAAAPDRAA